jgi:hypothetical protein
MEYLKVRWIHEHPNEPVVLMSELDEDRYEVRKVEVFADGRIEFASNDHSSGETVLGETAIPSPAQIASDPQFVVEVFDAQRFEEAWLSAISGCN